MWLFSFQQAVSAVIIQNFPFLTVRVEFFAIFSYCLHFAKFIFKSSTLQYETPKW
jgi:hypothetical protein